MDRFFDRMSLWLNLKTLGCKTMLEMPEPSRSDCHAWAAHPVYHYLASILGIRPAAWLCIRQHPSAVGAFAMGQRGHASPARYDRRGIYNA